MANSATLLNTTYIPGKRKQENVIVYNYSVIFDTVPGDLTVLAADPLMHIGLVAIHGIIGSASDLLFKETATQIAKLSLAANQALDYRMGPPILWTSKNKAFVMNSSVAHNNFFLSLVKWDTLMPVL